MIVIGPQFAYSISMDGGSERAPDADGPATRYANGLQIGHNAFEFVFAFIQQYGEAASRTQTRIVTSPAYAKSFLHTLTASIGQYEAEFGMIVAAYTDAERDH